MERTGRGIRNFALFSACVAALALGNLFIRFSCVRTLRDFEAMYERDRLTRARAAAAGLESQLRAVEALLGTLAGYGPMRDGPMDARMRVLGRTAAPAAGVDAVDLFWIQRDGAAWATADTRLALPAEPLLPPVVRKPAQPPLFKSGLVYETKNGAKGKGVMALVPVYAVPPPAGTGQFVGYIGALFSLENSVGKSAGLEMGASLFAAVVGGGGEFVFHPDDDFTGAEVSGALDLERFSRLKKIMEKMREGGEGVAPYDYFDSREGKRVVKWLAAYAPVRVEGAEWSLGVFEEGSGAGFAAGIVREHIVFALVFSLTVALVGFVLFRVNREVLLLRHKVKGLQDATALSGILRSVNMELSEAKKTLEMNVGEYDEAILRVQQAADRLVEACTLLGETNRRPSREQRECMRDVRFESSRLRGEIGRLKRK